MHTSSIALLIAPAASANLHLVVAKLPVLAVNPASVFAFLLVMGSVGAVAWFGRSKGPRA